jgi:hypothetical protein
VSALWDALRLVAAYAIALWPFWIPVFLAAAASYALRVRRARSGGAGAVAPGALRWSGPIVGLAYLVWLAAFTSYLGDGNQVLRLVTAVSYGAALLLTALSVIGLLVVERGHGIVLGGWAFCTAGLFAVGRLAHLARRNDDS